MIKTKLSGRRARSDGVFCNYQHRICMQDRLDGFEYCFNHILEDKNSPYKQCQFISSKNGRRCINPAPKADKKDGHCSEHARRARLVCQKATMKPKPPTSTKELFEELDYHRTGSSSAMPDIPVSAAAKILEYGSDSDSDGEPLLVDHTWKGSNDSDAESVDSEQEDLLKHAGIYTAEEVALITMDKLIRLQSLYINQFKRLQHLMKEKRRKYLKALQQERDTIGTDLGKITNLHEKIKFIKLQVMRTYRRRRGKEALLQRKSKHRRIQSTPEYTGPQPTRIELQCSYVKDGRQCNKPTLPIARFCGNHILSDPLQVLFSPCSKGQGFCQRPACIMSEDYTCLLHTTLAPKQLRLQQPPDQDTATSSAMTDHDYGQKPTVGSDGGGDNRTNMVRIASELASSLAVQLSSQVPSVSAGGDAVPAGGESKEDQHLEQQMLQLQQQIQQQIQEQQLHLASQQESIIQPQQASSSITDQSTHNTVQPKASDEVHEQESGLELMVLQKPKGQFPIIQLHQVPKTPTSPEASHPEIMEVDQPSDLIEPQQKSSISS